MKLEVFSILDQKAGVFAQPFYAANIAVGCRNVEAFMRDGSSMPAKFPEDFALYHLGTFDDSTGAFSSLSPIVLVAGLKSFKGGSNGSDAP